MINKTINNLNKQIVDVRMKNRMNEHIQNILQNQGTAKLLRNIILKNDKEKLVIKKNKDHITYTYITDSYKEKYQIIKLEEEYITEFMNNEKKQISVFKQEQEIINHIEEKNMETTYIRTDENNILLIEKTKEETNYYIGINENKYENYIPENSIFTEIEKDDYIKLVTHEIPEQEIIKKYFIPEKKLHLQ